MPETVSADRVRSIGRVGLAVVMVIGPLTQVLYLLLQPWPWDSDDYVRDVAAHTDTYADLAWISLVGAMTLAPAVIGLGIVAMRGAPLLGLLGMVLTVPGMLNADGNPDDIIYAGARAGAPEQTVKDMLDRVVELPATGDFGFYVFVCAFGVGSLLLGIALLIGESAPRWAAGAIILTAVVFFIGLFVELDAIVAVLAWAVATVGFAGCGLALTRPHPVPRATNP